MTATIYTARQHVAVEFVSTDAAEVVKFAAMTRDWCCGTAPHFIVEARRGAEVIAEVDVRGIRPDGFDPNPLSMYAPTLKLLDLVAAYDAERRTR